MTRRGADRGVFVWLRLVFAGLMLAALAACSNSFDANVTRFQAQLPPPQGQSFAIVADDANLAGGIEFGQYARLVAAKLTGLGYTEAPGPDEAQLIVRFKYGVDNGHSYTTSDGFYGDPFWGPWQGMGFYGYGGYGGFGGWGGFGDWGDPGFGPDIETTLLYTSDISLKIDDRASGRRLFEGKAQAVSDSNHLNYLVPNLINAMFTHFPGNSGETVRISIPPEHKPGH